MELPEVSMCAKRLRVEAWTEQCGVERATNGAGMVVDQVKVEVSYRIKEGWNRVQRKAAGRALATSGCRACSETRLATLRNGYFPSELAPWYCSTRNTETRIPQI